MNGSARINLRLEMRLNSASTKRLRQRRAYGVAPPCRLDLVESEEPQLLTASTLAAGVVVAWLVLPWGMKAR